uniref:Somatostatin 1, tandem duplicate 1 n=1 Tax=Gasterosteus aculeatus TaxID=69293 RepID=G3NKP3_GASAC
TGTLTSANCIRAALTGQTQKILRPAERQRDGKLHLLLHRTPLLSSKQDMSRASLVELLLSDLLQVQNEALEEENLAPAGGEPEEVHLDLERAADAGPLLGPRERKAGCKNFFWKTFTSC